MMVINSDGYIHIIEYLTEHLSLFEKQPNALPDTKTTVIMEIETQLTEQVISVFLQNELLISDQRNAIISEIDLIASDLTEIFSSVADNLITSEQQAFIQEFAILIKNLFDAEVYTLVEQSKVH